MPALVGYRNAVTQGGLFPAKRPQAYVVAPSIFSQWSTRQLTVKELLECWDILQSCTGEFDALQPKDYEGVPFIKSPPSKVLFGVISAHFAVERTTLRGQGHTTHQVQEVSSPLDPINTVLSKCTEETSGLDLDVTPLRQRAAKDDDAAVPTHFWDRPFWSKFLSWGRTPQFVQQVSQLSFGRSQSVVLDILREFVLRVWRRSVYRSFRSYMLTTHRPGSWVRLPLAGSWRLLLGMVFWLEAFLLAVAS